MVSEREVWLALEFDMPPRKRTKKTGADQQSSRTNDEAPVASAAVALGIAQPAPASTHDPTMAETLPRIAQTPADVAPDVVPTTRSDSEAGPSRSKKSSKLQAAIECKKRELEQLLALEENQSPDETSSNEASGNETSNDEPTPKTTPISRETSVRNAEDKDIRGKAKKLPPPEKPQEYSGEPSLPKFEMWVLSMENYLQHFDEQGWFAYVVSRIQGDALRWFSNHQNELSTRGDPIMSTWAEVRDGLRNYLVPKNEYSHYRQELDKIRQLGSIREYHQKFSYLWNALGLHDEKEKCYLFHRGLQGWYAYEMTRMSSRVEKSLEDLVAQLEQLETDRQRGRNVEVKRLWVVCANAYPEVSKLESSTKNGVMTAGMIKLLSTSSWYSAPTPDVVWMISCIGMATQGVFRLRKERSLETKFS